MTACPSTEGGKNWPPMTYYPPGNRLIVPLSQSRLDMNGQATNAGDPADVANGRSGPTRGIGVTVVSDNHMALVTAPRS